MIRTDNYHPHRRRYKIGEEATDMSESSVEGETSHLTQLNPKLYSKNFFSHFVTQLNPKLYSKKVKVAI